MKNQKVNLTDGVVYNNFEISTMRKYLKDIAMISNKGNFPKYEIEKLASVLNLGGETVDNYFERMEID